MYKVAVLIRKNPALSNDQFRAHYEEVHAPLAAGFMPKLRRYTRHFTSVYGDTVYASGSSPEIDVITEMWFDSEADFHETMAHLATPAVATALGDDERHVFDRGSIRIFALEDSGDLIE